MYKKTFCIKNIYSLYMAYVLTWDDKKIAGIVHSNDHQVPHRKHSIVSKMESKR